MRFLFAAAAALLITTPALAHETGDEHDHAPNRARFALTGSFGALLGRSLGGEYEECESPTICYEQKRPFSTLLEGRFGYQLAGTDLSLEAGLGYIGGLEMSLGRRTTLYGEQNVPVSVDIRDEVKVSGPYALIGASYAVLRKPIITALALSLGQWWTSLEATRSGTAVTAEQPSPRSMRPSSPDAVKTAMTVVVPEVRVAYPVTTNLHIGVSLGAFVAFGEARPKIVQTPEPTATDPQPKDPATGRAIGFVPQPNAPPESAMDSPILFRSALYVSGVF